MQAVERQGGFGRSDRVWEGPQNLPTSTRSAIRRDGWNEWPERPGWPGPASRRRQAPDAPLLVALGGGADSAVGAWAAAGLGRPGAHGHRRPRPARSHL